MGIDAKHLREHVVGPALVAIEAWSQAAENLVMGTAAQESHLEYLVQLGSGPAVGIFQMEPATYNDIWVNYLEYKPDLAARIRTAVATNQGTPPAERMIWDLRYAAILCRVHYLRKPGALPSAADIPGLAAYWKKHYNTPLGAGTEAEFIKNYDRVMVGE